MFAACTRVEVTDPVPAPSILDGGTSGMPSGNPSLTAGQGGDGGRGEEPPMGGAPGVIEVGLWPTFVADPTRSRDVQAVSAAVSSLSAGSRTLPLAERWDALSGATGSPRTVTWSRLDAMVKPYADRRGKIALCINIVDREQPAWPFVEELDTEAAASAMRRTIDEVYARYAPQLSHLCFGYQLDLYLAKASRVAQRRFLAFLKQSVDYASSHPARASAAIGPAVSLRALTGAGDLPLEDLLVGDELLAVYDPLDENAELKAPQAVAGELSAALETLASARGMRIPLDLLEIGYPSDSSLGSSEKDQNAFYNALFRALSESRDGIGFVGVYGLGDRASTDCDAEASMFGGTAEARALRSLTRCTMGLRAGGDAGQGVAMATDKQAWPTVLAAISRFR